MKMNCIINPARILNRFGKAWLIKRANRKHKLVGGSADDCTDAKEWASLSAHELFSPGRILSIKREMFVVSAMG
jgi:hypothetical protein